ncbi:MAG: GerMN domain-containing protein [Treponema sp.]|jgi:hypothetical protein|nr:GerMN domain-containing protein [Treponema sp.]
MNAALLTPQQQSRSDVVSVLKLSISVVFLLALGALALLDFRAAGRIRRTFVFYTIREQTEVVEARMFPRIVDGLVEERDIHRYVEEALLGPVSPDLGLLFPRGTRLRSLLYRDGRVYVNLSESAVLPAALDVFQRLHILREGIDRNFSFVKEVKIFIEGHEVG